MWLSVPSKVLAAEICSSLCSFIRYDICVIFDFLDVTQRRLVISYRRFVQCICLIFKGEVLNMGPIGCSETSTANYQSTLRNGPKKQRSNLHRGGNLKPHLCISVDRYQDFGICQLNDTVSRPRKL